MASQEQIILYDLPSRAPCKAWSLNPWKTRFLLNYKGLDYRTEWTEYPDLKGKLEPHVAPGQGPAPYTSPTVRLPDGTFVMDSAVIRGEIETRYPNPPVHLDSPVLAKLEKIMTEIMPALAGVYIPLVPVRLLNDASQPYWYETREKRVGMKLDQFAQEKGGQPAWDNAKQYIDQVSTMLKEDSSGPFFLGKEISYADFVWGGFLVFLQRIGNDVWESFQRTAGENSDLHSKLLLGLDPYSVRSDR